MIPFFIDFQIFYSIVLSIMIYVVNTFIGLDATTYFNLDQINMLKYVSTSSWPFVGWLINPDISITIYSPSTFPTGVVLPFDVFPSSHVDYYSTLF